MDPENKMGPEAAATAVRTPAVYSLGKQTSPVCSKSDGSASEFVECRAQKIVRRSLRAAINAMCKSCLYDPGNGNGGWREQVGGCSSSNCALHPVRPLPVKGRKCGEEALGPPLAAVSAKEGLDAFSGMKVGHNDVTVDIGRAA